VPLDLDPADVGEVKRRVVDPVVATMLKPGELTSLTIGIELAEASWWAFDHFGEEPQVWLRLAVGDEEFEHRVCKPGFWLDDIEWIAGTLEDQLNEWICETRFGWGELRSGPEFAHLPGPRAVPSGLRAISVHANEPGHLPLWEAGAPADVATFVLSTELKDDLLAWQRLGEELAEAAEARAPRPPAPTTPAGMWVEYVTERSALTRHAAAVSRREQALAEWHTWVDQLQPVRDALVQRLQTELGPRFIVPIPPRLPILS
jgi:hypothetical protein